MTTIITTTYSPPVDSPIDYTLPNSYQEVHRLTAPLIKLGIKHVAPPVQLVYMQAAPFGGSSAPHNIALAFRRTLSPIGKQLNLYLLTHTHSCTSCTQMRPST